MKLAPNISLVGNLATSSSDIKAGVPFLGGLSVAHSTMVLYDADLQLDIPVTSSMSGVSFSPFIQAGAGGIHYDISAASVLIALPTVLVFVLLQKQFVSGLTLGAKKG